MEAPWRSPPLDIDLFIFKKKSPLLTVARAARRRAAAAQDPGQADGRSRRGGGHLAAPTPSPNAPMKPNQVALPLDIELFRAKTRSLLPHGAVAGRRWVVTVEDPAQFRPPLLALRCCGLPTRSDAHKTEFSAQRRLYRGPSKPGGRGGAIKACKPGQAISGCDLRWHRPGS